MPTLENIVLNQTMGIEDQITFLVSTCDAYSSCWMPFCHGLRKYWPEHPRKLLFVTNQKIVECGKSIRVGLDMGWARNLLFALQQVDTPYVLYAQEDYWLKRRVIHTHIIDYVRLLETDRADYIRLFPVPQPTLKYPYDDRLGILTDNDEYRTSLQMSLWRKKVLVDLLKPDESPWQFEVRGNQRSRSYKSRFLCVRHANYGVDYVFTAVISGEWSKLAYRYAEVEDISVRFDDLPQKRFFKRAADRIRAFLYPLKRRLRLALQKRSKYDEF